MSAHDVRHLTTCGKCPDLGDKRYMISFAKYHYHGRCAIKLLGMKGFLKLPKKQLGKMALDDIGPKAVRAILEKHYPSRQPK